MGAVHTGKGRLQQSTAAGTDYIDGAGTDVATNGETVVNVP